MRRRTTTSIAKLGAAVIAASLLAVPAGYADDEPEVGSATITALQETGPPANRFNMVIMGDGYTADELPQFREEVQTHLNVMWSMEPFRSYRNYMNVYMIEIVSGESGISCDPNLDSPRKNTPLSMSFWGGCNPNSVQRLVTMSNSAANRYANMIEGVTSSNRQILALANSDTYGGAGGAYATATGGNALSALISPHELSHSLGGLQDEYVYYARNENRGTYPSSSEPSSIHHTLLTAEEMLDQQVKWWRWLGEESESGGIIDVYEGGLYYSRGVWRPSLHSNMKMLGYYYDQVSRERLTQRLSGRTDIIESHTPTDGPVGRDQVLYVETLHPVYHELDVTWRVDGEVVDGDVDQRYLDLANHDVEFGSVVEVTVQDPTEFVRDPAVRNSSAMTATRSWTVGRAVEDVDLVFTNHTQTERAVGAEDAVYVTTTHANDRVLDVTWELNGQVVESAQGKRVFHLAEQNLATGNHTLSATVGDPANPDAEGETLTWTVDNVGAEVTKELSEPVATIDSGDGVHNVYFETFTMGLEATDNEPGAVVREFRLNGMGWHNYYGWPTDPDAPFRFTPTGTNIDDLQYGNLGDLGLTIAPFEEQWQEPGYGTHTIEYRGLDAALNHGDASEFKATVLPGEMPACTTTITGTESRRVTVRNGVTCLDGATLNGGITVLRGASLVATDSVIRGGITATNADDVMLINTDVYGRSQVTSTSDQVTFVSSTFDDRVSLVGNAGDGYGVLLVGNTFDGELTCQNNADGVQDFGASNTVRTATGQCSGL